MILVDFHPQIANRITQYCAHCGNGKREIQRFIASLVSRGYRHFIVHIEQPSDVWIADMLCYYRMNGIEDMVYSIGIWQYETDPCEWIEQLPFDWKTITKNAHRVFWRNQNWYDSHYRAERLYVSIGEKWYDACDRCFHLNA